MNRRQPKPGGGCVINREDFIKSFDINVPKLVIRTSADVHEKFSKANQILSNPNEEWDKRNLQLKTIRSVIIKGEEMLNPGEMLKSIIDLKSALEISIKDLRSQIVREAAITCSFIVQKYGNDVHTIGEQVLAPAFSQVAVSTKIMSTSAATLTGFIVEYIQTRQIFTILSQYSTSKDKSQRRQLAELLSLIITKWNERLKMQIMRQICELLKSAICDADSDTRVAGRRAFHHLDELHPDEAEAIFQAVEPSKQKLLRAAEGTSSCASVSGERSSIQVRSKLSGAGIRPNISSRFLAQRSASAIDPKVPGMSSGSRLVRPTSTKTMARVTSPANSMKSSNHPVLSSRTNSQSSPREVSPAVTKTPRRSIGAVPRSMDDIGKSFRNTRKGSQLDDEDEFFLLPMRKNDCNVESILRQCTSSSNSEKKEGIRGLAKIVGNVDLTDEEIKKVGSILNRLLSTDLTNSTVLESYSLFIRTHYSKLYDSLRLFMSKTFSKMGSEMLSNTKHQLHDIINAILVSFDPMKQLVAVCELMCDPIHLMVPKARAALIDYMTELFAHHMERGQNYYCPQLMKSILKMFAWLEDPRVAPMLTHGIERFFCAMFSTNSAEFSSIIREIDGRYRQRAYEIVQAKSINMEHGQQFTPRKTSNDNTVRLPELTRKSRNDYSICSPSLGAFTSFQAIANESNTTQINLDTTVELSQDMLEQQTEFNDMLNRLQKSTHAFDENQIISDIYSRMTDGSFNVWEPFYAKLLLSTFEIMTKSEWEANKKVGLRILSRMCIAQASRLFDSTEMAVCKVLDVAVESTDATTGIAVEDCLRTLATHLPLNKIVNIANVILNQEPIDDSRASYILKMIAKMYEDLPNEDLSKILDELVPSVIKAYGSKSSSARKNVIYCLVAMVNKLGLKSIDRFMTKMPKAMINLVHVYVNRSITSSASKL